MTSPLRIGIAGINGRMGSETARVAADDPRVHLVGGIARPGSPAEHSADWLVTSDAAELLGQIDCLIDLSLPSATVSLARAAVAHRVPLLCGVTGLEQSQIDALREASTLIPVHLSRNLSQGIPVIADLLRQLSAALGGFDVELTETHHRGKRDAPSGTALLLAEAVAEGREQVLEAQVQYGRYGESPRQLGEIGVHSLRAGSLPGEHTILFAGDDEEIRISHRALSRRAFVQGAIVAAIALTGQSPGFQVT